MANRAYLYALSHAPRGYADRPDRISGLSEWPYEVPFMHRLLMSGNPQLCASLISDGLDPDDEGDDAADGETSGETAPKTASKTALHAIASPFEPGFARVSRLVAIIQVLIAQDAVAQTASTGPSGLWARASQLLGLAREKAPQPLPPSTQQLAESLDQTLEFLQAHRDDFVLLETVELDIMSSSHEQELRALVQGEIARCQQAGAAVDALPSNLADAAAVLKRATAQQTGGPLDALFGLRLDDECDNTRDRCTQYPLGLMWDEVLYFALWNRAEFAARKP